MKTNRIPQTVACILSVCMISSCTMTPPLSQMLPPASKHRLAVVPNKAVQKEHGISYTDAGLQAGNMYGIAGMLVAGVMRSVTLSHNAAFSSKWKQSGKVAGEIILDEFRKELARNGYTLDDTAPDKLHISPGAGMATCDRPNAAASNKKYFAMCTPLVSVETGGKRKSYLPLFSQSISTSHFVYETVTVESYEALLREAARLSTRKIIFGVDPKTGKPR